MRKRKKNSGRIIRKYRAIKRTKLGRFRAWQTKFHHTRRRRHHKIRLTRLKRTKASRRRVKNGRWTKARKAMWRHGDRPTGSIGYWKKADRLRKRFSKLHRLRKFKYQAAQRRRVSNKRRR